MRKLLAIALAIIVLPSYCMAGNDNYCSWTALHFTARLNDRWSVGNYSEGRFKDSGFDQVFFRMFGSYKAGAGFQLKFQNDFAFLSSGFSLRLIPEVMWTRKTGALAFSLRQRMMWSWKKESGQWTLWHRTRGMVVWDIAGSRLSPLFAVEPFYRDVLSRCRYYFGVKMPVGAGTSLMLQYMRQDFTGAHADDNVLWLTCSFHIP